MRAVLVGLGLVAVACVRPSYWGRPGATPQLWAQELLACEAAVTPAWQVTWGAAAAMDADLAWRRRRTLCLQARGWRKYAGRRPNGSDPDRAPPLE